MMTDINQPIRVGFIGLNAQGSWATNSHLPYLKDSTKYKIVALLNSSEESAKAAVKAHGLPAETRTYGSPEDIATDEEIDMVVCSVRVDRHYPVLKPILESGKLKAVHSEWPLGKNLAEAEELASLAKSKGIKTIVGLQGRKTPTVHKAKEILDSGKLGKVLSVTVTMVGFNFGAEDNKTIGYLSDISIGGNMVSIHFMHTFDTITRTLGELKTYDCILETKRSETILIDKSFNYDQGTDETNSKKIVGTVPRTSHDQILIQGHFESGALLSLHMRGGGPFPGQPGMIWTIYGEKGELRITTPTINLHFGGPGHEIWYHDHETGKSEQIELPKDEYDEKGLPETARNPARIYDAFVAGRTDEYADWDEAVRRHKLIEEMYNKNK